MMPQIYLQSSKLLGTLPTKDQLAAGMDTPAAVTADGDIADGRRRLGDDPSDPRVREVFRKATQD